MNRKNRLHNPYIPTVVVDDFFETPDMIRAFALQQEFFKGSRGYWPGVRSQFLEDISTELYNLLTYKILKVLPQFTKFEKFESTFHLSGKNYVRGWVHDDAPDLNVAGFLYLSPDPPPNSGTSFFDDTTPSMPASFLDAFKQDVLRMPDELPLPELDKYRDEQLTWFKKSLTVDNVYNRAIIFDPKTWHAANDFFGTTKEDTRLTLVYFGKAV
jgi:hypothetical protein